MQALYQIDVLGTADQRVVFEALDEGYDPLDVREEATELAIAAWHGRSGADALVAELAPDWPTHRQPPVDRAILRLAHHEIRSGHAPAKVAINEAVELAKQFGSEHSPAFINGVLDKVARRVKPEGPVDASGPPVAADAWLNDALGDDEKA